MYWLYHRYYAPCVDETNTSPSEFHVEMFVLADYLIMNQLKRTAAEYFGASISKAWGDRSFWNAAKAVFNVEIRSVSKDLRQKILEVIGQHASTLTDTRFCEELMDDCHDFAKDLAFFMMKRSVQVATSLQQTPAKRHIRGRLGLLV